MEQEPPPPVRAQADTAPRSLVRGQTRQTALCRGRKTMRQSQYMCSLCAVQAAEGAVHGASSTADAPQHVESRRLSLGTLMGKKVRGGRMCFPALAPLLMPLRPP